MTNREQHIARSDVKSAIKEIKLVLKEHERELCREVSYGLNTKPTVPFGASWNTIDGKMHIELRFTRTK